MDSTMIKIDKNGCEFYLKRVTYLENGILETKYTDTPIEFIDMMNRYGRITDLKVYDLIPTVEQSKRLDKLNKTKLDMIEYWSNEAYMFVEYGYIDKRLINSTLYGLYKAYEKETLEYLHSTIKDKLAKYRYSVEVTDLVFKNNMIIKTDRNTLSFIKTQLNIINLNIIENISFKFSNGWMLLDRNNFNLLARRVITHVDKAFNTEYLSTVEIDKMSLDELLLLNDDVKNITAIYDSIWDKQKNNI
jgi:hypothetical protein